MTAQVQHIETLLAQCLARTQYLLKWAGLLDLSQALRDIVTLQDHADTLLTHVEENCEWYKAQARRKARLVQWRRRNRRKERTEKTLWRLFRREQPEDRLPHVPSNPAKPDKKARKLRSKLELAIEFLRKENPAKANFYASQLRAEAVSAESAAPPSQCDPVFLKDYARLLTDEKYRSARRVAWEKYFPRHGFATV